MPIYEFECKNGHRFEKLFSINDCPKNLLCEYCPRVPGIISRGSVPSLAEKVFSAPANINIGKPTIIFKNPRTGEVEVAASDYDTPRPGFVKEELKNPIERSKFERTVQARQDLANEIITEKLKQDHSETRKNRHADIESRMSSFPNDGTREFLRKAMNRKSKRKFPEKKSQVKLTVNHTDSSNLIK